MTRLLHFLMAVAILTSTAFAQKGGRDDIQLFNEMGTVTGHVEIANHPTLGRTPCRNCPFLLVKQNCKRCAVYVKTDAEGNYRSRMSFGRWRVVMVEQREGSSAVIDMLSPKQSRYVDVNSPTGEKKFDIETVTPPE